MTTLRRLFQDDSGQDAAEYAVLMFLITTMLLAAITTFGSTIAGIVNDARTVIEQASA